MKATTARLREEKLLIILINSSIAMAEDSGRTTTMEKEEMANTTSKKSNSRDLITTIQLKEASNPTYRINMPISREEPRTSLARFTLLKIVG